MKQVIAIRLPRPPFHVTPLRAQVYGSRTPLHSSHEDTKTTYSYGICTKSFQGSHIQIQRNLTYIILIFPLQTILFSRLLKKNKFHVYHVLLKFLHMEKLATFEPIVLQLLASMSRYLLDITPFLSHW